MQNSKRKEKITKEITDISSPRTGYEPVPKEGCEVGIRLTDDQICFIDQVAQRFDLQFWAAFEMVWNDSFSLLVQQSQAQSAYFQLPFFNKKNKVFG